eukprot:SAG11_NODE_8263_length_1037_cov_2.350746_1_plen_123_part_00
MPGGAGAGRPRARHAPNDRSHRSHSTRIWPKRTHFLPSRSQYWEDHPEVKDAAFPAWQHYTNVGEESGYLWHSDLCNFCNVNDASGNVGSLPGTQGGTPGADENPYSYETGQVCIGVGSNAI